MALKFARNLATALKQPTVRQFVKEGVLEQFDGDYNFLFATHKDKPLNMATPDGRIQEMSFKEVLFGPEATNTRSQESAFLDSLAQLYPLLQIALPELAAASAETWDVENETPLVAVVPEDMTDVSSITAYDWQGNAVAVMVNEEPENPLIVISNNEGLVPVSKEAGSRLDCPINSEPYLNTGNTNYYLREDYYAAMNMCDGGIGISPGNGGNPGDNNCDCERDCKSTAEKLFRIKFFDKASLDNIEPWIFGKVELLAVMVYSTKNGAAAIRQPKTISRKDLLSCSGIFGNRTCETNWASVNVTFTQYLPDFGSQINVHMYDEDFARPFTSNEYVTVSITTIINDEVYINDARFEVSSDREYMGMTEIKYCDPADPLGGNYSNSYLRFNWGHE